MNDSHPPSDPRPPQGDSVDEWGGLNPRNLFAEGLHTPPTAGKWTPPSAEHVAQLLPQYRVEALLGHGGMGAVYQGAQPKLERLVAIKLLPSELAADIEFVARFEREARTLAKLHHPNIVAIYDFGQTREGHLYFVMEFVKGTDLARLIATRAMDAKLALQLTIQICDALNYAHHQRVIHRDIKPSNVLVTEDGRAKLADFGLARPMDEQDLALTASHRVMGTPDYMAPEQHAGLGDHRVDIYALGVMLYEMLTGQRPRGVFDPPSMKVQVDVRLDDVVVKAMREEPERRYQQASEMRVDVDRIRATPQPKAANLEKQAEAAPLKPAPTLAERPAKNALRRWIVPLAAVALAAILSVIAVEKHWLGSSPDQSGVPGRATPSQSPRFAGNKTPPASATKDEPFVNSIGMRFVPVPIAGGPTDKQPVLFSVWDTRVLDYEAYARESKREMWKPPFSQGSTHPVVNTSWEDAQSFCQWLTTRERGKGQIPGNWGYRLPTDHEWSCAVGIGDKEDAETPPGEKSDKVRDLFPWGSQWPPPEKVGNYSSEELREALTTVNYTNVRDFIPGYYDGHAATSPVGSFPGNLYGLFDMGGNVWQWCEDWNEREKLGRVRRGGCWNNGTKAHLQSSHREQSPPSDRFTGFGFRCVLASSPTGSTSPPFSSFVPEAAWRDRLARSDNWDAHWKRVGREMHPMDSGAGQSFPEKLADAGLRVRFRLQRERGSLWLSLRRSIPMGPGSSYMVAVSCNPTDFSAIHFATPSPPLQKIASLAPHEPVRTGEEHTAELYAIGNRLTFFLDGQPLGAAQDTKLTEGYINIGATAATELLGVETTDLSAPIPKATPPSSKTISAPPEASGQARDTRLQSRP